MFSSWSSVKGDMNNSNEPPSDSQSSHHYRDRGFGDDYSAGRGERDSAFEYYRKHTMASTAHKQWAHRTEARPIPGATPTPIPNTTGGTILKATHDEPVEMTCMNCRHGNCMYVPNQGASFGNSSVGCVGPYCADCNRAVLASGTQGLK